MRKKEKSFGVKLYSMFLISILFPVVIAMASFWMYVGRASIEREEKNSQYILNSVSQNLELQFSENDNIRDTFYVNKKVFQQAESMNNAKLYQYYDELTRIDIENTYVVTLTKMLHTSALNVRAVVFFPASDGDTAYYLGKERAEIQEITYQDYREEEWFQKIINGEEDSYYTSGIPDYITNKELGEIYSYMVPLQDVDSNRIIGVIRMDVSMKTLQSTLDAVGDAKNTGMLLMQKDKILAKSSELGDVTGITEKRIQINGKNFQFVKKSIPETNLEIAYIYSHSGIYREFFVVSLLAALVVAAGLSVAFLYYRKQATQMVNDVQKITDVIQSVESGDLRQHIGPLTNSEFEKIAEAINHMIDSLKEYIEKEYILVIQQQKAEYKALQSQINPHFLYNTLNGFVALNRMGEKKILEKSIIELSRLFRYVCGRQEMARVKEEIAFLEDYLKLEKLKYDERLEYMIWIDEECKEKMIPKLLLQPIVENSIKHGMGDTDDPIMIRISATGADVQGIGKVMVLTVRDNGVGFKENSRDDGSQHVGIQNVKTRAELYCKDVIFQCVSKPGQGTKTTFIFPEEEEQEEL